MDQKELFEVAVDTFMDAYSPGFKASENNLWSDVVLGCIRDEPQYILSLAMSIREYGIKSPVVTEEDVVADGHRRVVAAYLAGLKTRVPYLA